MNKLTLVIPEMTTVSRSSERTINLSNYIKGHDYESWKTSAFRSRQLPADTSKELLDKCSNELFLECEAEVERNVVNKITSFKVEAGEYVAPNAKELLQISSFIKELAEGGKSTVDSVAQKIAAQKDNLVESQLTFLRHLVLSIKNS